MESPRTVPGTRLDPWVDAYAARTRGLTASQVRALFAVASRPEVVSLAGGMPFVSALPLDQLADTVARLLRERGHQALAVMEKHLAQAAWFTGPAYGVADIALFAYTHCAGEGGFDLAAFPHITDWLARVRAQPGFVPMPGVSDEVAMRLASS